MSDRRLATVASLLGLTLLVYAMVGVRVAYSGNDHYVALVWNLFLAWVPFVVALAVYAGFRRGAGRLPLAAGGALWLLFLPNAPYLVTDLGYLGEWRGAPLWYDVVLASGAAWAGLALGFLSLYLVHAVVRSLFGALNAWFFALGALALSSFGIYLGRFERWNSWDLFVRPRALLGDIWSGAMNPGAQVEAVAVTIAFTVFLAATYLVFYSFVSFSGSPSRDARQ
jgi:uncharacterized membrane protein